MRLQDRQSDGSALRDHLIAAARNGAEPDARLHAEAPAGMSQLWSAYTSMSSARVGESCIAPSEMLAWQRLHAVRLSPWEVGTIEAVDRACVAVLRAQSAKRRAVK